MVAWKTLVRIIAILAAFLILIFAVVVPFMEKAEEAGKSSMCGLKMYLFSIQKKITLGLKVPKAPAECRVNVVEITPDMIEKKIDYAEVAIDKYYGNPQKYAEALQYFDDSESSKWEWVVDKIIADQLFDCWAFKAVFGSLDTTSLLSFKEANCLECSLIKFSDVYDIKEKIGIPKKPFIADPDYIGSLGAFLRAETKGFGKDEKTYSEWINNEYQFYPVQEVPYKIDKKSEYAVIYVMTADYETLPLVGKVQKSWMEFLPSKFLTTTYDAPFFGQTHKACEIVIGT